MKYAKYILTIIIVVLILLVVIVQKKRTHYVRGSDMCISCHKEERDVSKSHPKSIMGCSTCHLGNPYVLNKKEACKGVIKYPSDLSVCEKTCGDCHKALIEDVKNSLMATNRGIISSLLYQWGFSPSPNKEIDIDTLKNEKKNIAIDHFNKMCASCHLWKQLGVGKGEIGTRGGGCANCHLINDDKKKHPLLTTRIPSENCTKCHNRSDRIGLSYFGKFESEGYGTPYENGHLSSNRLSGGRFFYHLPSDVHWSEAKMDCIDCHTMKGVMGWGKRKNHLEAQEEIQCKDCHSPHFQEVERDTLPLTLSFLNEKVPLKAGDMVAVASRGSLLYNVKKVKGKVILYRKRDGRPIEIKLTKEKAYHTASYHKSLSCSACHSKWIPQCYGCHEVLFKGLKQKNWLTQKIEEGRWVELRSYLRFAYPQLGVGENGEIMPIAPGCQTYLSVFDKDYNLKQKNIINLGIAAFDPHTTNKSHTCIECHSYPKTLGFGEGSLNFDFKNNTFNFKPLYDVKKSHLGDIALDQMINEEGEPLQITSRLHARPLNKQELLRMWRPSACVVCHDKYDDKIYKDFDKSFKMFIRGKGKRCSGSPY